MPEHDLPWPPERPPTPKAVKKAWAELHTGTIAYLKRQIPVSEHEERALLKALHPRELHLRIVTEEQHAESAADDMADDVDLRPLFNRPSDDETSYEQDDDEEENGDLATTDDELYRAETRFCLAMSLEWRESRVIDSPLPIQAYEYRRISLHPDTAAYLISRVQKHHRKTIADALIFDLVGQDGEQLAEEEWDDGDVAPAWRNRKNDPAMDVLLICTHLQDLYFRLVAGEHTDEYMNDDPDAPME